MDALQLAKSQSTNCEDGELFDESHEEASLCFQYWVKVRKRFRTRIPLEEFVQLHNKRGYLNKVRQKKETSKENNVNST